MRVAEAMTRGAKIASPDQSVFDAATMMADADCGSLPVGENDRLVGVITDRDIVVRALAKGRGANAKIRDVMSPAVKYCYEDDDIEQVAHNMADLQVRRLPVLDQNKRLMGVISLGDIANAEQREPAVDALCGISKHH